MSVILASPQINKLASGQTTQALKLVRLRYLRLRGAISAPAVIPAAPRYLRFSGRYFCQLCYPLSHDTHASMSLAPPPGGNPANSDTRRAKVPTCLKRLRLLAAETLPAVIPAELWCQRVCDTCASSEQYLCQRPNHSSSETNASAIPAPLRADKPAILDAC